MPSLTRLVLRRPIGTTAVCLLVAGLACAAFLRLPVALLPELQFPSLAVWTSVPDVTPERVEQLVTEPLEEALAGTPGLQGMTSRSQLGGSLIRLDFGWSTNLDLALFSIREELDRRKRNLPEAAARPVILRLDPSARPIVWIALRPGQGALQDDAGSLSPLAREVFARRLEQIPGVARVLVSGSRQRRIEVMVDPERLAGFGLSLGDVETAVQRANVSLVGGQVLKGPFIRILEVSGEYRNVEEVEETVIASGDRGLVRLRDVARINQAWAPRRGQVRLDESEALLLLVERRPDSNTVATAKAVREAVDQLEQQFPAIELEVVVDESHFIRVAIRGLVIAAASGGVLAVLVLLCFVRRAGPILALLLAIPLSLALTLILFDAFDITFNLISLGGLALGIGLLVDNAIVVVENIARQSDLGLTPRQAGEVGARQVAIPITASTLTTIAVFGPLTFVEGLAGRLFRDQSLAVVCSLVASLLVALTVVPLVATRLKSATITPSRRQRRQSLLATYESTLRLCLRHPRAFILFLMVFLIVTSTLAWVLPREILPPTEQDRLMMSLELPGGVGFDSFARESAVVEQKVRQLPGVDRVLADLGERDQTQIELDPQTTSEGTLVVTLEPGASPRVVAEEIRRILEGSALDGSVRSARTRLEQLISPVGQDLYLDFLAPLRRDADGAAQALLPALSQQPGLINVTRFREGYTPVYHLRLDRLAAARLGLPLEDLTAQLQATARGWKISDLYTVNEDVPIVVRAPSGQSLEAFLDQPLASNNGLYPLRTFVAVERRIAANTLLRQDQRPVVRLTADIAPGHDLAEAVRGADDARSLLPAGVRLQVRGSNEVFLDGLRAMGLSLLFSIGLVYLILAAQTENLLQPLIVLAAVPLAAAGAVLSLALTGQSVNLMSLTGCVVLVGIVVNDAIIKVDFINQERRRGSSLRHALLEAGKARFRPIIMTTMTTVLALLPLCFGLGTGSELQAPLAITLMGGLTSATALTLFAIPVLYQMLERLKYQSPELS